LRQIEVEENPNAQSALKLAHMNGWDPPGPVEENPKAQSALKLSLHGFDMSRIG